MRTKRSALIVLALLAVACQPRSQPVLTEPKVIRELVWPQPPLRPRIRYVRAVTSPEDLGIDPSLFERLLEIVAGKDQDWLIRPTGVAASGEKLFIADPGSQALWILDPQAGRMHKVHQVFDRQLISPVAITPGSNNHFYLADSYLASIFVLDNGGKAVRTISDSRFLRPSGLAFDASRDRLYVADSGAHKIWIFSGTGTPVGKIGQRGKNSGEFNFPSHLTIDSGGNLYVTDTLNFRLQVFDKNGAFTAQFGQHGDSSGNFASPKGVALDSEGHVYVVDALFDAVQIFDRHGRYLLTFGERGIKPGQFWLPNGLFIDSRDRIYVADAYNQRVQIFEYLAGIGNE